MHENYNRTDVHGRANSYYEHDEVYREGNLSSNDHVLNTF